MTAMEITGVVERAALIEQSDRAVMRYGRVSWPVVVEATVRTDEGVTAYIRTQVGEMYESMTAPAGGFSPPLTPPAVPWVRTTDGEVVTSNSPETFPGAVYVDVGRPRLTVAVGDRVTVRGSVARVTSCAGRAYVRVTRARLIAVVEAP